MTDIQLILVDPNTALCLAFQRAFSDLQKVEILNSYFEQAPDFDCLVSPANSFGLMDGGIDAAIIKFFGAELQSKVQKHILEVYLGEQPVGSCFILETGNSKHPYLAHTPTMRVPMEISRTDNIYRAIWSMLLEVRRHNQKNELQISTIACPGLGAGVGNTPPDEVARQMSLAYRHFLSPPKSITWEMADARQIQIRYGGYIGFRIPPGK